MDFAKFDLNLLKTLSVLLQEKNTNKAALRLNTSQPAVSRTLAKIRAHFDDPLLIRQSHGMKLTPKAEEIALRLPKILDDLQQTLYGEAFIPASQRGLMKIAMNGFIMETHGYQICEAINRAAPDLDIELHSYSAKSTAELVSGEIDFAISYYPLEVSKELRQVAVGALDFALICRHDHPLARKTISMNAVSEQSLAGLIVPEFNDKAMVIQRRLNMAEVKPKFRCQQVNPILKKIGESDILFVAPLCLLDELDAQQYSYVQVENEQTSNAVKVALIYNSRYMRSDKFLWLEGLIDQIIPPKVNFKKKVIS